MKNNQIDTQKTDNKQGKSKKIITRIINFFSVSFLIIAFLLLSYVFYCKFTGKTPQIFGYSFHFVVTDSMEPDIMTGDFVIGKKTTIEELYNQNIDRDPEDYDVILFDSPEYGEEGMVKVHKIFSFVETDDGEIVIRTYGVNNSDIDRTPTDEVIGRVVYVSSTLGKIFNPVTIIFILVIMLILIVFYFGITSFIKNYRELNSQDDDSDNGDDNKD